MGGFASASEPHSITRGTADRRAELFREGRSTPDISCPVEWGAASPDALPRNLRPAIAEAVEHVREQWSREAVEYDHAGNNDESNDNS
jgi:hypothetical protein